MPLTKITLYQAKLLIQRTVQPKAIALDLGINSTGVAATDPNFDEAYPIAIVKSSDSRFDPIFNKQMVTIIKRERPTILILGKCDPKYIQANEKHASIVARLNRCLDITFAQVDQWNSTSDAKDLLRDLSGKMGVKGMVGSKNLQDAFAAIVILKRFIDYCKK